MRAPAVRPGPRSLRNRLAPKPPPLLPELSILQATPASRLGSLAGAGRAPYWAYAWPGGCLLARYLLDNPGVVKGRRALDVGTGCGVVAIAAARAGASVSAVDIDPLACSAARLNAELNGVELDISSVDALRADAPDAPDAPDAHVVLAGDLFYDPAVAAEAGAFFDTMLAAGAEILVGDIGRQWLPRQRLHLLAAYDVPDFGSAEARTGSVYRWIG